LFGHVLATSNSPLRAVFTEDITALVAIVAAVLGMLFHQLTGSAVYDAIGSIVIGVLMAIAALVLIRSNARFLSGRPLEPEDRDHILAMLRGFPEVARVTFMYTEFIGPLRCMITAGVGIAGDYDQAELAAILRGIERKLMQRKYVGLAIITLATLEDPNLA
jgi:divalent metal cation (Fe/Co/Zn/Cd) transporter